MTHSNVTLLLFAGVGGVLLFASLVAYGLKHWVARDAPHGVIDNLVARINAWWVMVLVVGGVFAAGRTAVVALFFFVSLAALREFLTITYTRRGDHAALAMAVFFVLPFQYFLVWIEWYGLYSIFIPVYGFLLLPLIATLSQDTTRFLERVSVIQWALMVCVFCVSYVPALMNLNIPGYEGRQALLIIYLVIVVQGSDVLQYVWGKLLGRHKIAPQLSPSKTVEGFVGGAASATVLGGALYWVTPFAPWQSALMALLIVVMGFFGGLVMSAIKRDRGIKDWGTMIEGHGGMLDRIDSVCFAAPVFFHATRHFFEP